MKRQSVSKDKAKQLKNQYDENIWSFSRFRKFGSVSNCFNEMGSSFQNLMAVNVKLCGELAISFEIEKSQKLPRVQYEWREATGRKLSEIQVGANPFFTLNTMVNLKYRTRSGTQNQDSCRKSEKVTWYIISRERTNLTIRLCKTSSLFFKILESPLYQVEQQ